MAPHRLVGLARTAAASSQAEPYAALARALHEAGDLARARRALLVALGSQPRNSAALSQLGDVLSLQARPLARRIRTRTM